MPLYTVRLRDSMATGLMHTRRLGSAGKGRGRGVLLCGGCG